MSGNTGIVDGYRSPIKPVPPVLPLYPSYPSHPAYPAYQPGYYDSYYVAQTDTERESAESVDR